MSQEQQACIELAEDTKQKHEQLAIKCKEDVREVKEEVLQITTQTIQLVADGLWEITNKDKEQVERQIKNACAECSIKRRALNL